MKEVTFIMAARNAADTMGDAILSWKEHIQSLLGDRVELVVVEDGPTESVPWQKPGNQEGIRYYTIPWSGQAEARNRALSVSTSKYVAFLDADDIVYDGTVFLKYLEAIESDEKIGIVYGEVADAIVDSIGRYHPQDPRPIIAMKLQMVEPDVYVRVPAYRNFEGAELTLLQTCNITMPNTVLCRREAICQAGGFVRGIVCGEDGVLWRRIVERGWTMQHIPTSYQYYCTYQVGDKNQSRQLHQAPGTFHLMPHTNGRELEEEDGSIKLSVQHLQYQGFDENKDKVRAVWVSPITQRV